MRNEKESYQVSYNKKVAVIGAGLAGASMAYSLALRNVEVHVFEREPRSAMKTSGNPAGALTPAITADNREITQFSVRGYYLALAVLRRLKKTYTIQSNLCGLTHIGYDSLRRERFEKAMEEDYLNPEAHLSRMDSDSIFRKTPEGSSYLHLRSAGHVSPPDLCAAMLSQGVIRHFSTEIFEIRDNGFRDQGIENKSRVKANQKRSRGSAESVEPFDQKNRSELSDRNVTIHSSQGTYNFDAVILATGHERINIFPFVEFYNYLPMRSVRGQIVYLTEECIRRNFRTIDFPVLCFDGYLIPPVEHNGELISVLGATYQNYSDDIAASSEDEAYLRNKASKRLGMEIQKNDISGSRVGLRTATNDHLPIAGPVFGQEVVEYLQQNQNRKAESAEVYKKLRNSPSSSSVYLLSGLGSRGLVTANLCAELICSYLFEEPLPVERDLAIATHSLRFLLREMKKDPQHRSLPLKF